MDADGMTDIELIDVPPAALAGKNATTAIGAAPAASTSAPQSAAYPAPRIPPSYSQSPTTGPSAVSPALPTPPPKGAKSTGAQPAEQPAEAPTPSTHPTKLLRIYAPNQQKLTWSPDGASLAFLQGVEPKYGQYGQDRLAIVKVAGGATPDVLTDSLDRAVSSYVFNKDSTDNHRHHRRRHNRLPNHHQHANPRHQEDEPGSRHCVGAESPPPGTPPSSHRTTLRPQRFTPSRASTCGRSPSTPTPSSRN